MRTCLCFIFILLILPLHSRASAIILDQRDAIVWLPLQIISGTIKDFNTRKVTVHFNDSTFEINTAHNKFSFVQRLQRMKSSIWVEAKDSDQIIRSDTLLFQLGFKPVPVVKPFATVSKNIITLHSIVIYNPFDNQLSYHWKDDNHNPAPVTIHNSFDTIATLKLPGKNGTYYFNLFIQNGKDTVKYQTMIMKTDSGVHCFNIETDHAVWIDNAVMYEITPRVFANHGNYGDISAKLPELKKLGINVIWLQPIFKSQRKGQGYDIIDYFSLAPDLGDEAQLHELISIAKSLNIKVIFDFVPNHTSIFHPYALDCIKYREASHYYNFYQRANDGAKYSSLYRQDTLGFVHYFWKDLVNLDYENPEVQRWMIEACKYWLKKFDIDGYRFDAVWAVNARNPQFGKQLQVELKSIKPDILLLAEDKGADEHVYQNGFDAAYDWELDTTWISHWSWQYAYSSKNNLTIFNYPVAADRDDLLQKALFQNGDSLHLRLRFIENNDLPRFIEIHGLERKKMAAALEFSLPGVPLIYNGQEIGSHVYPYSSAPIFLADKTIQSLDKDSLFEYYQRLISLRKQYKSLRSINIKNLQVVPSAGILAYERWMNNEYFVVAINMSDTPQQVKISLDKIRSINQKKARYMLTDMLSTEIFSIKSGYAMIQMDSFSTRILMVKDLR
jgi:cyclomaltodextrinase